MTSQLLINMDFRANSSYLTSYSIGSYQWVDPYLNFILPPMSMPSYLQASKINLLAVATTLNPKLCDALTRANYDLSPKSIVLCRELKHDYHFYHQTCKKRKASSYFVMSCSQKWL